MAGIYVHIPFCKQACSYCDFHFSTVLKLKADVIQALKQEIVLRKHFFEQGTPGTIHSIPTGSDQSNDQAPNNPYHQTSDQQINLNQRNSHSPPQAPASGHLSESNASPTTTQIKTLYFGGGTPSLLESAELESLIQTLQQHFDLSQLTELTLEANPDDMSLEKLRAWKSMGINRLSVGIQSFLDEDLQLMRRAHSATEAWQAIENIHRAGLDHNFSIDLIYHLPGSTPEKLATNMEQAHKTGASHLSAYSLTVEAGTLLEHQIKASEVHPAAENTFREQFLALVTYLEGKGYQHYEISNFARPGYQAQHNSSYWAGAPYLGLGPSAHSFINRTRSWNHAHNPRYIKSLTANQLPTANEEQLSKKDRLNEEIMTRLRLNTGLDTHYLKTRYGTDLLQTEKHNLHHFMEQGWIKNENGTLILTTEGKLIADTLASELFQL